MVPGGVYMCAVCTLYTDNKPGHLRYTVSLFFCYEKKTEKLSFYESIT